MHNIIKRGLGAIQSLVSRGFGGLVVVEPGGGSISRLFPKNYIPKFLYYNVDGRVAFITTNVIFLKGILAFFDSSLYNIVGKYKSFDSFVAGCVGLASFANEFTVKINCWLRQVGTILLRLSGISSYSEVFNVEILGLKKYLINIQLNVFGFLKLYRERAIEVIGKKNLLPLLTAFGIFNQKEE